MHIDPYLSFEGRCDEAIAFYKKSLDAKVTRLLRFKDNPAPSAGCQPKPGTEEKVMHASLSIGSANVMVSDGQCKGNPTFTGIALSLAVKDDAEAQRRFTALSDGGQAIVPLAKTFFSSSFGMVTDPFGVTWMVLVAQ